MKKMLLASALLSVIALSGCTGREVAAGAVGAGAGYIIGKENH